MSVTPVGLNRRVERVPTVRFATVARRLGAATRAAGLTVPAYRTNGATFNDGKFTAVWHMQTNFVTDSTGHGFKASSIPVPSGITAPSS